jgi:uncharacterized protein YeaO (DUF488 family)
MPIRIVQLGSPRSADEGVRLGTVRRPPRGVPKSAFAERDFYDVWVPLLSPSAALLAEGRAAASPAAWARFERRFRAEMKTAAAGQLLDLLAALSADSHFSLGCYCVGEARCHRSVLRALLIERGAHVA